MKDIPYVVFTQRNRYWRVLSKTMSRVELHFGRITLFAMLRTKNTGDGVGDNDEKGTKFPFHLFPF